MLRWFPEPAGYDITAISTNVHPSYGISTSAREPAGVSLLWPVPARAAGIPGPPTIGIDAASRICSTDCWVRTTHMTTGQSHLPGTSDQNLSA